MVIEIDEHFETGCTYYAIMVVARKLLLWFLGFLG